MAATGKPRLKVKRTVAELEAELEKRTAERDEALARETATAEVLQVINASPGDLAPVFDAMLEKAIRLCGATYGHFRTYDGERFPLAAVRGEPSLVAIHRHHSILQLGPNHPIGRFLQGEDVIHIADAAAIPAYRSDPAWRDLVDTGACRSVLAVALRRDRTLLGYLNVYRSEVRPFSDKEIALLQNFAAQAVIAMENARLLDETREALEQQTATTEVLQVINASPGDLSPVFEAMLEKATRLCEGSQGVLWTIEDGSVRSAATFGVTPEYAAFLRRGATPGPTTPFGRIMRGERIVEITDLAEDEGYRAGDPVPRAAVEIGGLRSMIFVALLREETLLGAFAIARQEVRPFTDKQIALLQNFAAQAVIAMENARLITETREALEQQTATAEVLGVINSSPGDLVPVFDAILEKAHSLCGAAKGSLIIYDGQTFRGGATRGVSEAFTKFALAPQDRPASSPPGRLLAGERLVHIPDVRDLDAPIPRAAAEMEGARTVLYIPLRKDDALLGYITAYRQEVRPFSDKQIALLENFAAQAVIAMENARLMTETREALDQQTATAEVLGVINASPGDLAPVFDAILEKANYLCGTVFGVLWTFDGTHFFPGAVHGPQAFIDAIKDKPRAPTGGGTLHRHAAGEQLVHIEDMAAETGVYETNSTRRVFVDLGGGRSALSVALSKDDRILGAIQVYRQEVRPFTDKQVALLQNFAAQAVIAMENARLITETREALDQQTATAEVLQVINSSPGELAPVFEAMLEKATMLCDAHSGFLWTYDGERYRAAATRGLPPSFEEFVRDPRVPGPDTGIARLAAGEALVHFTDLAATGPYQSGDALHRASVDLGGFRTILVVPLRKDDVLLGGFTIDRQEVRPFTDKQIALLQSFAAQAVIAMENARLLGELQQRTGDLQESLEYQTATSDVLKVISRSAFDLQPVLDTLVATATRLCDAEVGHLAVRQGDAYRYVATLATDPAWDAAVRARAFMAGRGTMAGRTVLERQVVHVVDVATDPEYDMPEAVTLGKLRTLLGVPMLRGGEPIGVITLGRQRVKPFTERQIDLVRTFADQAVIAIENARLITETREARDGAEHALRDLKSAQANLIQAEKMASLGQLTAGIAHEIKNPLNFVNNFAGLSVELLDELRETAGPALATLDEDRRADIDETMEMLSGNLQKIGEHGRRADNIVKSMLEHSRGVSGERREVDVNGLIDEALNLAYHGARAQDQGFNITLERDYAATLPQIELAPQEMTRVFLNLFGNGFYAANKRARDNGDRSFRPVLSVVTRDLGEAVEVKVRDNGTGIPPEIRDKLFQPFFTTKPTGEGTGLGLSISYDIVTQQHGGSIEVESRVGEFTEFTVRLPRHP